MDTAAKHDQEAIPAVYMRGGTSKGVFLHEGDVPPAGEARDALMLGIMGSPDPTQIDGMGGTFSSTSKVIVVGCEGDGLVRYSFGQVGISDPIVDWRSNCGNLTTAVGVFAIDEGLIEATEPSTTVRLLNENTGVRIDAEVQVRSGRSAVAGNTVVDGVPGAGSPVLTRYLHPAGGVYSSALPTGQAQQVLETSGGPVTVSLVDVVAPYLLVHADESLPFDVFGAPVDELNRQGGNLEWAEELRSLAAAAAAASLRSPAPSSPTVPRIAFVRPLTGSDGVEVRALSMGRVHRAVPITGALCIGSATQIPGTVVSSPHGGTARLPADESRVVRVAHPRGHTDVHVDLAEDGSIASAAVTRTARRIMAGDLFVAR